MGFRRVLSTAATAAAHAADRLSHGLVFVAGGLMTLADHHRLATGAHENALSGAEDAMAGLNPTEERAYRQVVRVGAQLCVIGGGSGRDVLPFVTRGHEVVAVDPDRDALATLTRLLRARELSAVVVPGFAEDVALPGTFDAVILSPHCYSYVPGSSRRVALLDKLRTHLNPGGPHCHQLSMPARRVDIDGRADCGRGRPVDRVGLSVGTARHPPTRARPARTIPAVRTPLSPGRSVG